MNLVRWGRKFWCTFCLYHFLSSSHLFLLPIFSHLNLSTVYKLQPSPMRQTLVHKTQSSPRLSQGGEGRSKTWHGSAPQQGFRGRRHLSCHSRGADSDIFKVQTLISSRSTMRNIWANQTKMSAASCRKHIPCRKSWHYSSSARYYCSELWDQCCQRSWLFLRESEKFFNVCKITWAYVN